jgi:hypothetical protein
MRQVFVGLLVALGVVLPLVFQSGNGAPPPVKAADAAAVVADGPSDLGWG